jgi:hypothetical protein
VQGNTKVALEHEQEASVEQLVHGVANDLGFGQVADVDFTLAHFVAVAYHAQHNGGLHQRVLVAQAAQLLVLRHALQGVEVDKIGACPARGCS